MADPHRWLALLGRAEIKDDRIVFKGGMTTLANGQPGFEVVNIISDQYFGGGRIRAGIEFADRHQYSGVGLILYYNPQLQAFIEAQIGGPSLCSVHTWSGQQWTTHAASGSPDQLLSGLRYDLEVSVTGSRVVMNLNGVRALEARLPFPLPYGQAGVWATGPTDITVLDFAVAAQKPKLFVIMQFSPPFDELYTDVIQPVGTAAGFSVIRADEIQGPGFIVADIERQILEAKAIVADITPTNANVYWEVGYAYAVRKPTVLVAERDTKLPFDISGFRTLYYDNTIGGKAKIEDGLRKHLLAIQTEWTAS